MYNKPRGGYSRGNSFQKKGRSGGSGFGRRKFLGDKIDINRFINKAQEVKEPAKITEPQYSFEDLGIHKELKKAIASRGFVTPLPIQNKAIPLILEGIDIVGLSNTGTGKTAAFLIPIIHKILTNIQEKAIVIVPTRELANQIQDEFSALAGRLNIFSVVLVGGVHIQKQIRDLERRHNLIIGTPGRLKDLISRRKLDLSLFGNVILDEADRMLDMGFIGDVKMLLSMSAKKRQTMLFSATFSPEIERLVNSFLNNPRKISLKSGETSNHISQDIVRINRNENKIEVLHNLLIQNQFKKVLIFSRTKRGADNLSQKLYQRGFKTDSIHGDKPQNKRQRVLKMFRDNAINILVATDVAARGLDIPNVSHVINFDIPASFDDYVHRIGRTGRVDRHGTALTFVE